MEPTSAVESSSAASVEAAKAGLPSEAVASRNPAVAETTEGAGVHAGWCVRHNRPMTKMVGVVSAQMIVVAIHDRCAVRDVGVVVVDDVATVVPIESPAVPAPAEAAIE